jgi:penicillin V acylase-like amidase (Ntn superfamily)
MQNAMKSPSAAVRASVSSHLSTGTGVGRNANCVARRRVAVVTVVFAALALLAPSADACSRVFLNDNDVARIVVRSMDLPLSQPERPRLVVFPRGAERDCTRSVLPGVQGAIEGLGPNTLRWRSKYGSVVIVGYDAGTSDGVNEHGLAAHMLALHAAQLEPKDNRPELSDALWVQYVLDNFKTVDEVVADHGTGNWRLTPVTCPQLGGSVTIGMHLAVEDSSGDSAVIEYTRGRLCVYHGPQYKFMTNDPPMDKMLRQMKQYRAFGGWKALPGKSIKGEHRFARLAAYYKMLPEPKNDTEALAGAISLMRIAEIPFRDPEEDTDMNPGPLVVGAYNLLQRMQHPFREQKEADRNPWAMWRGCQTNWISVGDLTNNVYYVQSSYALGIGRVALKDIDLSEGAPIRWLDPHEGRLEGDLGKELKEWQVR